MAVDTRNKRSSAIAPACPWRGLWPTPDGTIAAVDRTHAAFLYAGIVVGAITGFDIPGLTFTAGGAQLHFTGKERTTLTSSPSATFTGGERPTFTTRDPDTFTGSDDDG